MKKLDKHAKCPKCNKSWDNGSIFDTHRKQECCKGMTDEELLEDIKRCYNEPYRFSKLVGIEVRGKYDGISYWQCPFCNATWDRWTSKEVVLDENT